MPAVRFTPRTFDIRIGTTSRDLRRWIDEAEFMQLQFVFNRLVGRYGYDFAVRVLQDASAFARRPCDLEFLSTLVDLACFGGTTFG